MRNFSGGPLRFLGVIWGSLGALVVSLRFLVRLGVLMGRLRVFSGDSRAVLDLRSIEFCRFDLLGGLLEVSWAVLEAFSAAAGHLGRPGTIF